MSTEIATLERVRSAMASLRQSGVKVTAEKIINHIGGGSKSTVIDHMRTLRTPAMQTDDALLSIMDMARPMLSEIFEAGRRAEAARTRMVSERLTVMAEELDAQVQELLDDNTWLQEMVRVMEERLRQAELINTELIRQREAAQAARAELSEKLDAERSKSAESLRHAISRIEGLVSKDRSFEHARARTRPKLSLPRNQVSGSSSSQKDS